MDVLRNLFKKKKTVPASDTLQIYEQADIQHNTEELIFVTIDMNARYLPIDRGEYVEDPLEKIVTELEIGSLDGGGTLAEKGKPVKRCDASFFITSDKLETFTEIVKSFPPIPKGSFLKYETPSGDRVSIPIGTAECILVEFDNTLNETVYKENDINNFIEIIVDQLGENFVSFAYWNGQDATFAFFYCYSFIAAEPVVKALVESSPLGTNAIIGRDA